MASATPQDPRKQELKQPFPKQKQEAPGTEQEMQPKPDHGEKSYQGHGRLKGRKALITGADSGIGRAVAIAFAREGADVALCYVPGVEDTDADETARCTTARQCAGSCTSPATSRAFRPSFSTSAFTSWASSCSLR